MMTELLSDIQVNNQGCNLCPRACNVNRHAGAIGFCRVTSDIKVARAALHMWEEPCISGENGSGTVFFAGCSLGCVFCQNHEISKGSQGKDITIERLVEIFFELEAQGANNINLVTADHYIPWVAIAIRQAKSKGLGIPFVYNTSAYVRVESLRQLDGLIDIYLPDFKYCDRDVAKRYSFAPDYPEVARTAIGEMVRQVPYCEFNQQGIMTRGVIVRHLLLPGQLLAAKAIVKELYETYGNAIYISLMNQYTPMPGIAEKCPELANPVQKKNYRKLVDYALSLGVEQGFMQEGETAMESFIPQFDGYGV